MGRKPPATRITAKQKQEQVLLVLRFLVLRFLVRSGGRGDKVQRVAVARRWCRSGLSGSKGQPIRAVKKPRIVEPSGGGSGSQ